MISGLWISYFEFLDVGFKMSILPPVRLLGYLHCYFGLISPQMCLILFDNAKGERYLDEFLGIVLGGALSLCLAMFSIMSMFPTTHFEGECT